MTDIIEEISELSPKEYIIVKGAKVNNLKNISLAIPRNKLIVVTGLSGSGKSSLAFDTLFAEGQRMYVESLSAYTRQFMGKMEKPDVEMILGLSPAIAVEQKGNSKNPRATVGTTTEIYDYLKLLFSRIGVTYSPVSGKQVKKDSITDVVNFIHSFEEGQRLYVLSPIFQQEKRTLLEELKVIFQKGFTRVHFNDQLIFIEEILNDPEKYANDQKEDFLVLIDRNTVIKEDEDNQFRIADSVQTAFFEGNGTCLIEILGIEKKSFSDKFEADGILFEIPTTQFFSFNNPHGACRRCGGLGTALELDEDLIIPDKSFSIAGGAVAPWQTPKMSEFRKLFIQQALEYDFPIHRPYQDLTQEQIDFLWNGNEEIVGILPFFNIIEKEAQAQKIQYRVMLSRFRNKITCKDCKGTRIRKDVAYVKIHGVSIIDLVLMPINELELFFKNLKLNEYDFQISKRILVELENRITYLSKVGLGYLSLNRLTSSLSGGEFQRIKLATALGSALVGSMYILDEPSIGLHPRDTKLLVEVLKDLRNLGNTVIVVEHEEEMMMAADELIDIGPEAGTGGGNVVFQGNWEEVKKQKNFGKSRSHTVQFLNGDDQVAIPKERRIWKHKIEIKGASLHNLKNVDVTFPLEVFTVVTGVSGSGKSTLVKEILFPALLNKYQQTPLSKNFNSISGDFNILQNVLMIDQNPIGKSTRSNAVTYTKIYDNIRQLFSRTPLAKSRFYDIGTFSFNSGNGRCDVCQGEGVINIEMQFMADVHLTCESCNGKRFKKEVLEVLYNDKNIADVLDMTVDEALLFFKDSKRIINGLAPLSEVGLDYLRLGQSTNTLSGGEAQRLKLASFLDKNQSTTIDKFLFIFDEPTTGLHFHDIKKLLASLNALIALGHSVLVIEHNLELIKCADWIIDIGPDSGNKGGTICFEGIPEDMIKLDNNYTAQYLKGKL